MQVKTLIRDKKIDSILYVSGQYPQGPFAPAILNLAAIMKMDLEMDLSNMNS